MAVDKSIFKAYDIRGIYPSSLSEDLAYKIGRAYATLLTEENPNKQLNIVVSGDMRLSTPKLKPKLIKGLIDSGCNVIDVNMLTTPTFYFAVAYYGYDGGIQVSASHNPKDYNGFKMVRKNAVPISGDSGIMDIRDMVLNEDFVATDKKGAISKKFNVTQEAVRVEREYVKGWNNIKPMHIVVDAANALGSIDIDEIFKDLPIKLTRINWELDGSFPSHQPDPLKEENLELLRQKVKELEADLGIAPDGDGDRYFIVDEKGQILRQEILRGIIAQEVLKDHPGVKIGYDIRPGRITVDMIKEAGGTPVITKVGHSLIKEQMIREDLFFAGESSGHYYFTFDFGKFDAPIVLIHYFLRYLTRENKPLSVLSAPLQKYFNSGEINSTVKDKDAKIKELIERYSDAKNISTLDGVLIEYDDFWFNVRPSNTEPKLRLNLEAISKEIMEEKRDEVLSIIRE